MAATSPFSVRLTQQEHEQLKEIAAAESTTPHELVQQAVRDLIRSRRARIDAAMAQVLTEDAELLARLAEE